METTSLMSFSSNVKFLPDWLDFGDFKILMTLFKATQHSSFFKGHLKSMEFYINMGLLCAWILHKHHYYLFICQEWCLLTNQNHKCKQHSPQFLNHESQNLILVMHCFSQTFSPEDVCFRWFLQWEPKTIGYQVFQNWQTQIDTLVIIFVQWQITASLHKQPFI